VDRTPTGNHLVTTESVHNYL